MAAKSVKILRGLGIEKRNSMSSNNPVVVPDIENRLNTPILATKAHGRVAHIGPNLDAEPRFPQARHLVHHDALPSHSIERLIRGWDIGIRVWSSWPAVKCKLDASPSGSVCAI